MTDRSSLRESLSEQLAQELELLRQFHNVLLEEHEILTQRSLEKMEEVVERKQSLLEAFQSAVNARMQTLQDLGTGETEDAVKAAIEESATAAPEIGETWASLQQLLDQCKEQNAINGAIIDLSTSGLQQALSILTDRTENTELYDAKGKTHHGDGSSSSLAKA